MLNIVGHKKKFISDVRAEKLFREAEDDFFYLNDIESAISKIEKALEFAPNVLKIILMRANMALIEGELEKALEFYKRAELIAPKNEKVLAALANIYEICSDYDKSLEYIDRALANLNLKFSPLRTALIDLKSNIYMKQKKYSEASKVIDVAKYSMITPDFRELSASNIAAIKRKLEIQKKIKNVGLYLVK